MLIFNRFDRGVAVAPIASHYFHIGDKAAFCGLGEIGFVAHESFLDGFHAVTGIFIDGAYQEIRWFLFMVFFFGLTVFAFFNMLLENSLKELDPFSESAAFP